MSPSQKRLYREVCSVYFPRWRPWKLVYIPRLLHHGKMGWCNVRERKIGISSLSKAVLIHEISHAITTKKHGIAWQTRMQRAIEIARVKEPELVLKLKYEVARCMSENDTHIRDLESQIMIEVQRDAASYHRHPNSLVGLLYDCNIFPEFDRRLYQRIHRKAVKIIKHTLKTPTVT
jgi:hypothetical protein